MWVCSQNSGNRGKPALLCGIISCLLPWSQTGSWTICLLAGRAGGLAVMSRLAELVLPARAAMLDLPCTYALALLNMDIWSHVVPSLSMAGLWAMIYEWVMHMGSGLGWRRRRCGSDVRPLGQMYKSTSKAKWSTTKDVKDFHIHTTWLRNACPAPLFGVY